MQRKSGKFLSAGLAMAAALAGGCGQRPAPRPEETGKRFGGAVLRVACPDEAARAAVVQYGSAWASASGGRLETALYDPVTGAPPEADVWVLEAAALPRWAAAGRLTPLPDGVRDDPAVAWGGLLPLYRERLLVWDDTVCGLPLWGDALLCFYRKDLFANAKHQAAYKARYQRDLQAPATWEEFADIAEYFYRQRGARPAPSLPPLPASEHGLDRLYYAVAAPFARRAVEEDTPDDKVPEADLFAFHFDLKTGQPRIASPGFVHALELLRRLQAYRPAAATTEPWRTFARGDAVLCVADCGRLGEFQQRGSPVWDRIGVCPVPGSRVYFDGETGRRHALGGSRINRVPYRGAGARLLAVPRSSAQTEAAFALLAELGGRGAADQIVVEPRWGGGIVRQSQLDREHWDSFRLDAERETELKRSLRQTFQPGIRNPLMCLRVPDERAFVEALTKEVRTALEEVKGGEGKKQEEARVLEAVARRWQALIRPRAAEHLRDYRLSLGLQAP